MLKYLFTLIITVVYIDVASAQDVYIEIPTSAIFNRSEYTTIGTIMNTQGHNSWRASPGKDPYIRSNSGDYFRHTSKPNTFLPTSVLHWRLASIGGSAPLFNRGDVWPDYKWFNSTYQTWYQPNSSSGRYNSGNIDFYFKIPQSQIANNAFYAGKYKIQLEQDYGRSFWYIIEFSPENFSAYISIPENITWLSILDSKTYSVTSLNQFRSGSSQTLINLGPMQIGHTLDFNLYAKIDESEIQFKPLKGDIRKINISSLKLGSNHPKLVTMPITKIWKNFSPNSNFTVEAGNRSDFEFQISISNDDFKNYFFEAGTYNFQIQIDARGIIESKGSEKYIQVALVVPALSEISLPSGNTEINFTFNTMLQYNEGQSKTIPNQIRISNNENYELYVKSSTTHFNSNGIQSDLNASILEVGVEGYSQKASLSKTSKKLLSNGKPILDKNLNITYSISPEAAQSLITKEKKAYEINIIYSFTVL